jgi:porin
MRPGCGFAAIVLVLSASVGVAQAAASTAASTPVERLATGAPNSPDGLAILLSGIASSGAAGSPDLWHREQLTGDWWGLRTRLAREGVFLYANLIADAFDDFSGGRREGQTGSSTVTFGLDVDTRDLLDLSGGRLHFSMQDHEGGNPSQTLVGDLQLFNRLSFPPYLEIFELWYQQELFGGKLRVKLAKADGNQDFAAVSNGQLFLNSSAQLEPTLFVLPTTPAPMDGVSVFYRPNPLVYAGFGLYNANRGDNYLIFRGNPQDLQPTPGGALLIGEGGLTWRDLSWIQADGDFRLGVWGHTGDFTKFDGELQHGTEGFYMILDQTLWKPATASGQDDRRGLRAFLEYGYTRQSVAPIYQHAGAGTTWRGPFASRPRDALGFGIEHAFLSPEGSFARSYESSLAAFYKAQLTPWASLEPNLQYIVNPGGLYRDALVGTLRAAMSF